MGYIKQNFVNGMVITEDRLNHIEEGIVNIAWADIKNKPFETVDTTPTDGSSNPVTSDGIYQAIDDVSEQANMLAAAFSPGSLRWDGVIGNRDYVVVEESDEAKVCFVHMSDKVLPIEFYEGLMLGGLCTISGLLAAQLGGGNGYHQCFPLVDAGLEVLEDGFLMGEVFCIVPYDNYNAGVTLDIPLVFPKRGIYFMSTIFKGEGIEIPFIYTSSLWNPIFSLEEAPKTSIGTSSSIPNVTINGDTISWNGNMNGMYVFTEDISQNTTLSLVKVSDATPTYNDIINGFTLNNSTSEEAFIATKDDILNADTGQLYVSLSEDGNSMQLGLISVFILYQQQLIDNIIVPKGTYFLYTSNSNENTNSYTSSLTIPGYTGWGTNAVSQSQPGVVYVDLMNTDEVDEDGNSIYTSTKSSEEVIALYKQGAQVIARLSLKESEEGGDLLFPLFAVSHDSNSNTAVIFLALLFTIELIGTTAKMSNSIG